MKVREKWLWLIIALLAATSAAQGYQLYQDKAARAAASAPDLWSREDEWFERTRKNLLKGGPIPFKDFDELFDDRFFGRRFDPFAEMRELEKRFHSRLGGPEQSLFGRSWDDWFADRMDFSGIETKTKETDKEVVVELTIPGLDKDSLNIDVNESRIRVAYEARNIQNKTDERGRQTLRSESVRRFEKVLPVPQNADGRSSRIERDGDTVKIVFPRTARGFKADA
jgi:HSP20 family molecular chaperone IbpA